MADEIDISRADLSREELIALLRSGVEHWNKWRQANVMLIPDLRGADLKLADLRGAALHTTDLSKSNLYEAHLEGANLTQAYLVEANLHRAILPEARLKFAHLQKANLNSADLVKANLRGANLYGTNLANAHLEQAQLQGAVLGGADLTHAHFKGADLTRADLRRATLVETSFIDATLDECMVYGVSAWDVRLDGATQKNLTITRPTDPPITVDNLDVAQFLYLMLRNQNIRQVIDTPTSKVVLILGRFTPARKVVLEALHNALRDRDYVPVVFDAPGPDNRDFTETVTLLARMARFVIADLTEPSSVPHELAKIVPDAQVPVQPLLLEGTTTYTMVQNLYIHKQFMLPVTTYTSLEDLIAILPQCVIEPAEAQVAEIQSDRATEFLRSRLPR